MSGEFTAADTAFLPDGPTETSTAERVAETIRSIDAGREPDMPLDILAKLVREAPLPSLAIAFMLGVIVARRQ
jgi:hypothetical protein